MNNILSFTGKEIYSSDDAVCAQQFSAHSAYADSCQTLSSSPIYGYIDTNTIVTQFITDQ